MYVTNSSKETFPFIKRKIITLNLLENYENIILSSPKQLVLVKTINWKLISHKQSSIYPVEHLPLISSYVPLTLRKHSIQNFT